MFDRIDHIGIACRDLDASVEFYTATFGLTVVSREINDEQAVEEAMLEVVPGRPGPGGGSYVQVITPTRDDSPVGRFLARHGEGLHHVGYGVTDVQAALRELAGRGIRLLDERPRHGSMGAAIAFLHPKDVGGVLTELVQAARA